MLIGQKLRELRREFNLTQKKFAQRIKTKIDYTYIGKIERGEQNPSLKILNKIANSLNIKLEYFFSDKPIGFYLSDQDENTKKREKITGLIYNFDEEELDFITGIIEFINKYKSIKKQYRTLKVAEKKDEYKTKE